MSRTKHGIDNAYVHLFHIGARPESGWRLCRKTWCGAEQSHFIMCNFHSSGLIFTEKKIRDIIFWAFLLQSD
jgi:hypothetical protein